jgi:wobble nucleotide-excising tRNase
VLINDVLVSITAETGPSFRNTLSVGDRNTVALAFFFASLDENRNLSCKIGVIVSTPGFMVQQSHTHTELITIRSEYRSAQLRLDR